VLVQPAVQYGVVAERLFRRALKRIFRRKLIEKCIEPEFLRYCPNWFSVEAPKTKLLIKKIKELGLASALVVTSDPDENLYLAARNLHTVDVLTPRQADPVSLLHFEKVVITKEAIAQLEESLS
jgi:ribosomal protein L4